MIKIFIKTNELKKHLNQLREAGKTIGFAPTMGALHQGHLSLILQSKAQCDVTVSSIFVNPTQFDNDEDLIKYPDTTRKDITMLDEKGTDILYLPTVEEVYPDGTKPTINYDFGYLTTIAEGAYREGHFEGVAQVVSILLDIVAPHKIFMGQKDFQQCALVHQLIQYKKIDTKIVVCPIIREADGLAMSSRNMRLNKQERKNAIVLSKALQWVKDNYNLMTIAELEHGAKDLINKTDFCKADYIEIRDRTSLKPISDNSIQQNVIVLGAAYVGSIRLIDNMVIYE